MMGSWRDPLDHLETEVQLATEAIVGSPGSLVILAKKGLMEREAKLVSKVYLDIQGHQANQGQKDPKEIWVKKENKVCGVLQAVEAHQVL